MQMNMTTTTPLAELRATLSKLPAGPVPEKASPRVIRLLTDCCDKLHGSDAESTWADKIWRAEDLRWNPPILEFMLERHCGTVNGSTRAELHTWAVDVDKATASVDSTSRFRQLYKREAPFTSTKALELSQQLQKLICAGKRDDRLKWHANGNVTVILSRCIGAAFKKTRAGRNRTLRDQLTPILKEVGWHAMSGSACRFQKSVPGDEAQMPGT